MQISNLPILLVLIFFLLSRECKAFRVKISYVGVEYTNIYV
jgi:hypothetical protein